MMSEAYAEQKQIVNDRLWTIDCHTRNGVGKPATYYVVGYSAEDAITALVRWYESESQPEGFSVKDFVFTARTS